MTVSSPGFSKAVLDGLDARSRELESKWGIGQLRLLVDDEMRFRFDQQQQMLRAAIAADDANEIFQHGAAMRRGWDALDAAATEAGAEPLHPEVWECILPNSGEAIAIVRTETEAHHICRECQVWTLAEIAILIERLGKDVRQVKELCPGAMVSGIRDQQQQLLDDTELAVADLMETVPQP